MELILVLAVLIFNIFEELLPFSSSICIIVFGDSLPSWIFESAGFLTEGRDIVKVFDRLRLLKINFANFIEENRYPT